VQLPGSDLVLGGQYSTEYEDWARFKTAVRTRLAWLAKLPESVKQNARPVGAEADLQEPGRGESAGGTEFAGTKGKDVQPFQAEAVNTRRVFVVHGRNMQARDAMFAFLRAIDLNPIEWEEAIDMTNETSPYIGHVVDIAFSKAQAAVILLTGDDMARLGRRYLTPSDQEYEKRLTPQARPNVIFEMGMAFGKYPGRTLIVGAPSLLPGLQTRPPRPAARIVRRAGAFLAR
jgi:hypothetical protein